MRQLLYIAACLALLSGAFAQQFGAPTRTATFSAPATGLGAKWTNGTLVRWRPNTFASDSTPNLFAYDQTGKELLRQRVWLPEASSISITDVAVSGNRMLAFAGKALASSGVVVGFWASVPLSGGTANVIQTEPFEGYNIVFGPDNTAWLFGWELGPNRNIRTAPPHSTLWHFGGDGKILGEFLPTQQVNCGGTHPAEQVKGISQLLANKDRIAVYSPTCNLWAEVSPDGTLIGSWRVPDLPASNQNMSISRLAMTSDDSVYANAGTNFFKLDRQRLAWHPIAKPILGSLWGSDGASLLFASKDGNVTWFPTQ